MYASPRCARAARVRLALAARSLLVALSLAYSAPPASLAQSCLAEPTGAPACDAPSDVGSHFRHDVATHHVGNPVDLLTGNKYQLESDFRSVSSPLMFSRHYNSALVDHDLGLGPGWRHSYHVVLSRVDDDRLQIVQSDGRRLLFAASETDAQGHTWHRSLTGRDGHVEVLDETSHLWHVPDGRLLRFHGSWLVEIAHDAHPERTLRLRYAGARLASVTDALGDVLTLRYTPGRVGLEGYDPASGLRAPGHLDAIVLPDGSEIDYRYDNRHNPIETRYPNRTSTTLTFTDPDWPHHLGSRRKSDAPYGLPTWQWHYDAHGRVARQEDEDGKRGFSLDYEPAAPTPDATAPTGRVIMRHDSGYIETYHWRRAEDGTAYIASRTGRKCEDCPERQFSPNAPTGTDRDADEALPGRPAPTMPRLSENSPTAERPTLPDSTGGDAAAADDELPFELTQGMQVAKLVDARGRRVWVITDHLGEVVDVVRGKSSMLKLQHDLQGPGLSCEGAPPIEEFLKEGQEIPPDLPWSAEELACMQALTELMDIANRFGTSGSALHPPTPREHKRQLTGSDRFCTTPSGRDCDELRRDLQMANLSDCAYSDTGSCGRHWNEVSADAVGLTEKDFVNKGFHARLFHNAETDEYVVAFRGTDSRHYDIREDLMQFNGALTSQYRQANRLARDLRAANPGIKLSYTGHSLGGGLATTAALTTGDKAIVFNAAALHERTAARLGLPFDEANEHVDNLTVDGELLTAVQDLERYPPGHNLFPNHDAHLTRREPEAHPAPGNRYLLPQPYYAWMEEQGDQFFLFRSDTIQSHRIVTVVESLVTLLEDACDQPRWLTRQLS